MFGFATKTGWLGILIGGAGYAFQELVSLFFLRRRAPQQQEAMPKSQRKELLIVFLSLYWTSQAFIGLHNGFVLHGLQWFQVGFDSFFSNSKIGALIQY